MTIQFASKTEPARPVGPSVSRGATGRTRPNGYLDDAGLAGPTGSFLAPIFRKKRQIGRTGLTGATGRTGPTGARGMRGPTGQSGAMGWPGITGATGRSGPTGPMGRRGPTGQSGAMGWPGQTGATGRTGPTGWTGAIGPVGATGPTGDKGERGALGPPGPPGQLDPIDVPDNSVLIGGFSAAFVIVSIVMFVLLALVIILYKRTASEKGDKRRAKRNDIHEANRKRGNLREPLNKAEWVPIKERVVYKKRSGNDEDINNESGRYEEDGETMDEIDFTEAANFTVMIGKHGASSECLSSGHMTKEHRSKLEENTVYLVQNILVEGTLLLEHLMDSNVLNNHMVEDIRGQRTNSDMVRHLLKFLPKRGEVAFCLFCDALRKTEQFFVADALESNKMVM